MAFTGNVFLTTSKEALDKVFFAKNKLNSFKESVALLSKDELENSIIVSPGRNSNLIEFDLSYGVLSTDGHALKIRLAETGSSFEYYYVSVNQDSILNRQLLEEYNKSRKVEDRIDSAYVKNLYYAFGVGDNLETWSGPFQGYMAKADFSIDSAGVKEIELVFTSDLSRFDRNYIENEFENSLRNDINRYNFVLSHKNTNYVAKVKAEGALELLETPHDLVVKLITDYITGLTGSSNEVIVLIPDLGKILKAYLSQPYFAKNQDAPLTRISEIYNILFGVKVYSAPDESLAAIPRTYDERVEYEEVRRRLGASKDKGFIKTLSDAANLPSYLESLKSKILEMSAASNNSNSPTETTPDYYVPLLRFEQSLIKFAAGINKNYSQILTVENDIRILKLLKEFGIIKSDKKPVYIFGDADLINKLIYLIDVRSIENILTFNDSSLSTSDKATYLKTPGIGYRAKFFNTFLKMDPGSSFKEQVFLKDELALPESLLKLVKFSNIPVFKHNLRNSNVLSLSVSHNGAYKGVYDVGFQYKDSLPYLNSSDRYIKEAVDKVKKNLESIDSIVELVNNYISLDDLKDFNSILGKVVTLFNDNNIFSRLEERNLYSSSKPNVFTAEELQVAVAFEIQRNLKPSNKPYITYDSSDEAVSLATTLQDNLKRASQKVSIRTLPFFHLCGPRIQSYPALLLGRGTRIANIGKDSAAFYSGMYTITGYKHVISSSEMYSEFMLQLNNENMVVNSLLNEKQEGIEKR
jgi:hypothetical protein